jgi:hypothetical protein
MEDSIKQLWGAVAGLKSGLELDLILSLAFNVFEFDSSQMTLLPGLQVEKYKSTMADKHARSIKIKEP